jgi:O-antigen/teichoic acid export membrane protein
MLRLRDFLTSSASLLLSQLLTAGAGFVFWLLASRTFSQSEVGFASAVISGISLVGAVGAMGLGTMLIRELPAHSGSEIGIILTSLLASAVFGSILGLAFVAVAPLLSTEFQPLHQSGLMIVLVVAGASATAASLVMDQALIGLLRSGLQLFRNVFAAVTRLVLLGLGATLALGSVGLGMIVPWVVSIGLSLLVLAAIAGRYGGLRGTHPFHWQFLGQQWVASLQHHVLNLAIQIPGWAMPIVAVAALSAHSNAGFFVAWQLVAIAAYVQSAFAWILYATAAREPASLAHWGWVTLKLSIGTSVASAIALWVLGPVVLSIFGPGYAEAGGEALFALPLTIIFSVFKGQYVTIQRVRRAVASGARLVAVASALEILGGFVGASVGGLRGLGIGVAIAMGIGVVPMLPTIFREIIRPRMHPRIPTTEEAGHELRD